MVDADFGNKGSVGGDSDGGRLSLPDEAAAGGRGAVCGWFVIASLFRCLYDTGNCFGPFGRDAAYTACQGRTENRWHCTVPKRMDAFLTPVVATGDPGRPKYTPAGRFSNLQSKKFYVFARK